MKAAVLISGFPRFTREFDDFLDQLRQGEQIDFFFHLWDADRSRDVRIPKSWKSGDYQFAYDKIQSNLKHNQKIVSLKILPEPEYRPSVEFRLSPWSVAPNIWNMYLGLKEVNATRVEYEKINGKYDIVIRSRADASLNEQIDLKAVHNYISKYPKNIITPNNQRHGLMGDPVNDQIAIGTSDTMNDYCKVFDHLEEYHKQGMIFHGETILSYHLRNYGIVFPPSDFEVRMRYYHTPAESNRDDELDHGRWT